MSCKPTYKGVRYNSLEELYRANGVNEQQKQQAQQLYSQYLDSLNKPNTNPILQGNQQEQIKKFIELQERLNNKEFLEGAKNAYESSKGLQEWGKDNGKEGKVLSVDAKNHKVVVEGVGVVTKHTKPSAANQNGGIIQKEAPIDISNVMLVHNGKTTRVGFKIEGDKKVRFAKSTGEVID